MATHATDKMRNVRASLYTWLAGLTLTGSPTLVYQDQMRTGTDTPDTWVRVSLEHLPPSFQGRFSTSLVAVNRDVLLILDVFKRDDSDQASTNIYAIDETADDLVSELTLMSIALTDYDSDETGATDTLARLRVLRPPTRRNPLPTDGYVRRQIQARVSWQSRKAA